MNPHNQRWSPPIICMTCDRFLRSLDLPSVVCMHLTWSTLDRLCMHIISTFGQKWIFHTRCAPTAFHNNHKICYWRNVFIQWCNPYANIIDHKNLTHFEKLNACVSIGSLRAHAYTSITVINHPIISGMYVLPVW